MMMMMMMMMMKMMKLVMRNMTKTDSLTNGEANFEAGVRSLDLPSPHNHSTDQCG